MTDKVRENRIRRSAERQSLQLHKSRRRDLQALDYGKYWLVDPVTGDTIFGGAHGVTLDQIEGWLEPPAPRERPDLDFVFFNQSERDVLAAIDLLVGLAQETDDEQIAYSVERLASAWAEKQERDENRRIDAMTDEEFEKYEKGEEL